MTNHTPGPWTLDPCVSGWMLISNGQDITAEPFDARDANARLIAAAPDLLAALQKIDANAAESVEWIRRVAQEAIAKATGSAA